MARRSSLAVPLAISLALMLAPAALAQDSAGSTFGHDDSRDGTPREIVSGAYSGDDGNNADGDPLADRRPNSYETFEFEVAEGERNGSFSVQVQWQDNRVDLDLYVYRRTASGGLAPNAVASSAAGGTDSETATYYPKISSEPVEAGRYVIVVDNWCSRNAEFPGCYAGPDPADEDDFIGRVSFGEGLPTNPLPAVTLNGPDRGNVGDSMTFTVDATDDGEIRNYSFDLDGDGRFEYDNAESDTIASRFEAPGAYNVGVRVTDEDGGSSYANKRVTITGRPTGSPEGTTTTTSVGVNLLSSFKLGRPVFGGVRNSRLTIRYRLRERASVIVSLYRGSKRVARLSRGSRVAARTYRITVIPRRLRRANYTVRIFVRSADGRRVQAARLSAKRL